MGHDYRHSRYVTKKASNSINVTDRSQQQLLVSVVNPAQIHAFGKTELTRAKTDKADARLIARYCRMHRPPAWVPPADEIVALQALVQRLEDLRALQNMESNRLESAEGPARTSVESVLEFITQQIQIVRLQIEIHIDNHPDLKKQQDLLSSIPGIGDDTAATLLAFLSPLDRFHSVKQVVAYAGLNPSIRQSGQWAGKTPIAKAGNALLRKMLFMPAVVAKKYNPLIAAFCNRLLLNGKRPMQVVVAAMRKLLHLAFGVLKSGKPFDPEFKVA
jgi:transposase